MMPKWLLQFWLSVRPQQPLRPLQIFQLILLIILLNIILAQGVAKYIFYGQLDFFLSLLLLIVLLCVREVLKGASGGKWHFHGICAATLFFALAHAWYYGQHRHEPAAVAFSAGLMIEFMVYMMLNKILAVLENRRYNELRNTADPKWHDGDVMESVEQTTIEVEGKTEGNGHVLRSQTKW